MEVIANKLIKFNNAFNANPFIQLIEDVSQSCYPLEHVERRPHLTMELPTLFSKSDNVDAVRLRSLCISAMFPYISQYMSLYSFSNMVPKKEFITVSKLEPGNSMAEHIDDDQINSNNFICMAYLNDNYEGGELSFPDLGISYKPRSGDVIIYQAKEKHMVTELISGTRYSIGYGLKGPIND